MFRELKGYHINDIYSNEVSITSEDRDTQSHTQLTSKKRIELCVKIYNTAASIMKTQSMWSLYIDAMIDLNNNKSTQPSLKQKCLLAAYQGAHDAKCLSEQQYLQYIELLKSNPEEEYQLKLCEVLENATEIYSNSIELWKLYLKYYMQKDDENKVYDIFAVASKIIGCDSLPLWELLKQYFLIKFTHENRKKVGLHLITHYHIPFKYSYVFNVKSKVTKKNPYVLILIIDGKHFQRSHQTA